MPKPKEPQEYPVTVAGISWQDLQKGDVIPADKIDEMWDILFGETRQKDVAFVTLNVKDWLERSRNSIGKPLVFKEVRGELTVLTDEQAVGYLNVQAMAGLRKHRSNTRRMFTHIDVGALDQHTADQLDRNQARHALIASAADGARRQTIKLQRSGSKLPRLMPPDMD